MKIYSSMVTTRVSNEKNTDQLRRNLSWNKKLFSSTISKTLSKLLKDKEVDDVLVSREYWAGHDLSGKVITERAMSQYGRRCLSLSHRATYECSLDENTSYVLCLRQLFTLCGLEYDSIRSAAIRFFESVVTRFSSKQISSIIKSMFSIIGDPCSSYYTAAGAIGLLRSGKILRRVCGSFDMIKGFIDCLGKAPSLLTVLVREDHREKLLDGLTEVVVKLSSEWHQPPFAVGDSMPEEVMKITLRLNGFNVDGSAEPLEMKAGLRLETLYSYLLSHMIGNGHPVNTGIFEWCISSIRQLSGQPSQLIALGCLTKLLHVASRDETSKAVCEAIGASLTTDTWIEILNGISACQPKHQIDGESPQWSRGIDQLLNSVEYIRSVLPRSDANELDSCSFSGQFRKENAAMITNMLRVFYSRASEDVIEMILDASGKLPHVSELEAKANVVTRAELFSGIYRYCHSPPLVATPAGSAIDSKLSSFLNDQVDKASLDMTKIWAEAVAFSCSVAPTYPSQYTVAMILNKFRTNRRPFEEDDGFSIQGKAFMLLRALLTADTYATIKFGEPVSMIGAVVTEIINSDDAQLCFPYRTSREEVGSILGLLVSSSVDVFKDSAPVARLSFLIHSATSESQDEDTINSSLVENVRSMRDKFALETATIWMEYIVHTTPLYRSTDVLSSLMKLVLKGCAHKDLEVSKLCQEISLTAANSVKVYLRQDSDALAVSLANLMALYTDSPWKVKEHILICLSVLLMNNGFVMTPEEKKRCRGIFVETFPDSRYELQQAAQIGLSIYFNHKPIQELNTLAAAYSKNCEIIADR